PLCAAPITFADESTRLFPVAGAGRAITPTTRQLGLDLREFTIDEVRVVACNVTKEVRATNVIVALVGYPLSGGLVMRPEVLVVLRAQLLSRFGDRASGPPAADGAGNSAEEGADWTSGRADPRAEQRSRDSSCRLSDLVTEARIAPMRTQRRVFRALDASVRRAPLRDILLSLCHANPLANRGAGDGARSGPA